MVSVVEADMGVVLGPGRVWAGAILWKSREFIHGLQMG
jgi:hypothetical protein